MQYGQIVLGLFILLVLYYIGMIVMDLQKANAAKAAELDNQSEEDIDISDEAEMFQPIQVTRDAPKKKQEKSGNEQPENKNDKYKTESDGAESSDGDEDGSDEQNEEEAQSEEEAPSEDPQPGRRPGYREPLMSDGIKVEDLLEYVNDISVNGTSDLVVIISCCHDLK